MMSSAAVIYDGLEYLYYHQTIGRYQMLHCEKWRKILDKEKTLLDFTDR